MWAYGAAVKVMESDEEMNVYEENNFCIMLTVF